MSSVVKNIIILVFFIVFFNYISESRAATTSTGIFNKLFFQSQPDSGFVNMTPLEKCMIRNWTECQIG